eukprot:366448-Chlamydomonas_euryale.AAC.3
MCARQQWAGLRALAGCCLAGSKQQAASHACQAPLYGGQEAAAGSCGLPMTPALCRRGDARSAGPTACLPGACQGPTACLPGACEGPTACQPGACEGPTACQPGVCQGPTACLPGACQGPTACLPGACKEQPAGNKEPPRDQNKGLVMAPLGCLAGG